VTASSDFGGFAGAGMRGEFCETRGNIMKRLGTLILMLASFGFFG